MSFIQVRDSDSLVTYVGKASPPARSAHTIYDETYNGPATWNGKHLVFRNGVNDYAPYAGATASDEGIAAVHLQKKACAEIMQEFQGENREKVLNATYTLTHLQEMIDDAELKVCERYATLGLLSHLKGVWDAKATNASWFTQARKDYYSARLQKMIDLYG